LAGALEILDSEFLSLRGQRNVLIDVHKSAYRERLEGRKRLDSARLLGFLECEYPDGLGWRKAEERGQPFKTHSDAICVNALQSAGIVTADSMKKVLRSKPYQKLVRAFADQQQLARTEISHFAVVLMALATRGPRLVELFFPDVVQDPGISAALALARKKK
jgi:hypothetical protein